MSEHIKVEADGAVLRVGFARPEKKNALTIEMYEAVADAVDRYGRDDGLRCLVMHGTDDTYTAGNDLMGFMQAQMAPQDANGGGEPASLRLMKAAEACEKPLVAAVEGWCVGIGATLLLHTDIVVLGRSAKLKMPFTELGIVPEAGASILVTRRYGRQVAGEMLLASGVMGAERAHQLGMANEVTEDGQALPAALRHAERLCAMSPTSVRMTKRLMREAQGLVPHMEEEMRQVGERVRSDEMRERVAGMMAKRG